jgi:acetyl-CoA acetyltransferase
MSGRAAIAGVGATPYYRRGASAPQTIHELIGKAVIAAVADAGLRMEDVDGFAFYAGGFEPGLIMEMLGIPEITYSAVVSSKGGGSAGILDLAASAVETGRARHVVCIGASLQARARYGATLENLAPTPEDAFFATAGLTGPGHMFALLTRRYMHRYGLARTALAEVAISTRQNALTR